MSSSAVSPSEVAHLDPGAKLEEDVVGPPQVPTKSEAANSVQIGSLSHTDKAETSDAHANGIQELEDEDGDDDADSDGYSNLSLYEQILEGDPDDHKFQGVKGVCTTEEAKQLRKRLRDVGPQAFIEETLGDERYSLPKLLSAFRINAPAYLEREQLLDLLGFAMYREMSVRQRLEQYSTIDDVVKLLQSSQNIMVITGAGISTSLGIPDFRSRNTGFYSKLRAMGLEDPESVFNLEDFDFDPSRFYALAGDLIPDLNKWSPTHQFIRILQDKNKLLRNYTQNIDNVESYAGIDSSKIIHCHGSWKTASCRKCKHSVPGQQLFPYLRRQEVAYCKACNLSATLQPAAMKRKRSHQSKPRKKTSHNGTPSFSDLDDDEDDDEADDDIPTPGVMKPDITFFGESLPDTFYDQLNNHDRTAVDLVIVIGTSMKVAPVSEIPQHLSRSVPHVYISRDECRHIEFDVTLLGDCDAVVAELCRRAGWDMVHPMLDDSVQYRVSKLQAAPTATNVEADGDDQASEIADGVWQITADGGAGTVDGAAAPVQGTTASSASTYVVPAVASAAHAGIKAVTKVLTE